MHTNLTFKAIMAAFGFWGWADIGAALLVVFGCAGEWWILLNERPKHSRIETTAGLLWKVLEYIDGIIRPVFTCLRITGYRLSEGKSHLLERFFMALVTVGVAIELLSLPFSLYEIAKVEKEAADANDRAGKAHQMVEGLRRESATLFAAGEEAKASAARSAEQAEKAKLEREKAEAGRLELEKQVLTLVEKTKTRNISKKAKDALVHDLAGIPKGSVEIVMFDKDPGSIAFGNDIKKALIGAGCSVAFSPKSIFNLDIIPGIVESGTDLVFCVKNALSPPAFARVILARLKLDGIKADGWPYNDGLVSDSLQIWVCPKAAIRDD
jgi:hypothetical protein